jgi:hypothetical protein
MPPVSSTPALNLNIEATLDNPNLWWNTLSNLQKAIRRGDQDQAKISAILLFNTDRIKLLRRMCVIALEDIGFGNIKLVGKVLDHAASHKAAHRPTAHPEELGACLALVAELAQSVKDRSPCQLAVASKVCTDSIRRVLRLTPEKCAAIYGDESEDMQMRCLAGQSLTGSLNIDKQRIGRADRKALVQALSTIDVPDKITAIAEIGAGFGGEVAGLAVNIPILYRPMKAESPKIRVNPLPPAELIRGLLSVSYDKHTLEGKYALAAFAANCKPLRQFSERVGAQAKKIIGLLVFMGEGSVVDRDIRCSLSDELYGWNEKAICTQIGLDYCALSEGKDILLDNLELLNRHRRRIAEAACYFDVQNDSARQGKLL